MWVKKLAAFVCNTVQWPNEKALGTARKGLKACLDGGGAAWGQETQLKAFFVVSRASSLVAAPYYAQLLQVF